jgi:hypothetical protein
VVVNHDSIYNVIPKDGLVGTSRPAGRIFALLASHREEKRIVLTFINHPNAGTAGKPRFSVAGSTGGLTVLTAVAFFRMHDQSF